MQKKKRIPFVPLFALACGLCAAAPALALGFVSGTSSTVLGRPLDFSRYEGLENDRFVLRSVTDEVMYELMTLSGQEYVDMYATRAKELIAEGSPADSRSMVPSDDD